MRVFIALPLPADVKSALERLQADLRRALAHAVVRYVNPAQIHLTLQFLGETPPERLEALSAATRAACAGFSRFPLRAIGAGCFPDARRPRVVWASLEGGLDALSALQASVASATGPFVEKPEDREFRPHLTLARIKALAPEEARALAVAIAALRTRRLGAWEAGEVEILASELRPEGSRHTCLERIPLGTPAVPPG